MRKSLFIFLLILILILTMFGCAETHRVLHKEDKVLQGQVYPLTPAVKPKTLLPEDWSKLAEATGDSKVTALAEETAPTVDDIFYIIADPGGTPTSKKITFANIGGKFIPTATSVPGTCSLGDLFWDSDDNLLYVCDPANSYVLVTGGSGAPTTATYITQVVDGTLSNEQALGLLNTGIMKNTTTTGVISIATAGSDYALPTQATDTFGALSDSTTNDSTTVQHGFLPKLGGGTTNFMRADGTWATPAGAANSALDMAPLSAAPASPVVGYIYVADGTTWDPAALSGTKAYYVYHGLDTTELMSSVADQTFFEASSWADVDLNSYDETDDLTITATVANQYCTLLNSSAPITLTKRYRMTFDVANIVSTWTIKDFNGTNTIGQVTGNGIGQTLEWVATDSAGELFTYTYDQTFIGGTPTWEDVDLVSGSGAYDETIDLTITAGAAGIGDYCRLPEASAPTTAGNRYTLTFNVANLAETWTIKDYDGTVTIGTVSANGAQSFNFTAVEAGGLQIIAVANDASGDFDNFTLNEAPGGYRIVADSTSSSGDFDNFELQELSYFPTVDEEGVMYPDLIIKQTDDSSPTSDDTIKVVDSPSSSPSIKEVTLANVIRKAHGLGINKITYINNSGTLSSVSVTGDNHLQFQTSATGPLESRAIAFADLPSLDKLDLTTLTSQPTTPEVGRIYLADGTTWDPAGLGIEKMYYVLVIENDAEIVDEANRIISGGTVDWTNEDLTTYTESGELVLGGNVGQYCYIAGTDDFETTNGKVYRFYYTSSGTSGFWNIKNNAATNTICTISSNETSYCEFTADDSVGGIRIISDFISAGITLDDFSLREIQYVALWDEDAVFYTASIAIPTLEEDEINDDTGPRLLTVIELKNKILSNAGLGANIEYDFPAQTEGWNFMAICETVLATDCTALDVPWDCCTASGVGANCPTAFDITLDPNGTESWFLNGTAVSAGGDYIANTTCAKGESIACISTEEAVYCESKYTNWVEE